jgi:hypothetical protein
MSLPSMRLDREQLSRFGRDERMRKLVGVATIIALIAIGVVLQPVFAALGFAFVLAVGWAVWESSPAKESED